MSLCLTFVEKHQLFLLKTAKVDYFIKPEHLQNPLGQGVFGKVYRGVSSSGKEIAIKQIPKANVREETVRREIDALRSNSLTPHNLLYLIDECEDSMYYYLITQYLSYGTLTKFVNKGSITSEEIALDYFRQIVYGYNQINKRKLIHRDLKPDNIFITQNNESTLPSEFLIVIGDFGLARDVSEMMTTNVGSKITSAPEINSEYTELVDIYSLGCILYFLLCGSYPFSTTSVDECEAQKRANSIKINALYSLSMLTMVILEGCLQYQSSKRMSVKELMMLLDIDHLYSNYHPIVIGIKDASNDICMKSRTKRVPRQEDYTATKYAEVESEPPMIEVNLKHIINSKDEYIKELQSKIAEKDIIIKKLQRESKENKEHYEQQQVGLEEQLTLLQQENTTLNASATKKENRLTRSKLKLDEVNKTVQKLTKQVEDNQKDQIEAHNKIQQLIESLSESCDSNFKPIPPAITNISDKIKYIIAEYNQCHSRFQVNSLIMSSVSLCGKPEGHKEDNKQAKLPFSEIFSNIKKCDMFYHDKKTLNNLMLCVLTHDKLHILKSHRIINLSKITNIEYEPLKCLNISVYQEDRVILANPDPLALIEWGRQLSKIHI